MKHKLTAFFLCLMILPVFAQHREDIRVASYNLRMDTARDSLNAWNYRKENVRGLIRYHDFDIIGTQEGFLHQLKDLLELQEYDYSGAGRDDGKEAGEHSAIFYKKDRFEKEDSGDFWLSETPDVPGKGWDATCCNRICSWVKLKDKKTRKTFYVFNVHFDHQGVVARKESGKLMVDKIAEIAGDAPVICTGDFNSTPETEQIGRMSAVLQDAFSATETPPYGPVGTTNGFRFNAPMKNRIDYVFVSKDFKVAQYAVLTDFREQRYPSDHLPVVARVYFRE
ncbi:endonuclease/exonuclease/phosphatase family protein [Sinomicrobium soli]|uniref:endonuclease/exonuclease/phosphatase family protein n=1 Tax=Sinomicrobium sp. N-1-3-6 TaxID=2219864 RepID=UPI000DCCCBCF|nr:endonuclease/exonuclease/phosphatase family protein [Sinomicrobium sp. N-1-3-6]RAV27746.1 endonuclease [Sinomicrobium sp. N-1-3-6]